MTKHNMEVSYFPSKEDAEQVQINYKGKMILAFWPDRKDVLVDVENMKELGLVLTRNRKLSPRLLTEPLEEEEEPEGVTYKTGQLFSVDGFGGVYILAQVGYAEVCLVSLKDGNRLKEPIRVVDISEITEEEMLDITGDSGYSLVE